MWSILAATALASPPSLVEPARSGETHPHDAAVVVGIEDYAFLPDVPHARRDLAAVAEMLVYTRGVPADKVQRLDGGNREQILAAVERARGQVGPDGTLWVYFAGHGAADPADGRLLLVGDDAKPDPAAFAARSLDVAALTDSLPDGAVVLLDTCWAGAARTGEALLADSRFAVPTWAVPAPDRVTLWTAAAPSELAGAYHPARHGAFTYFAVGALRGWADGELSGDRDGVVTWDEASAWVTRALAATGTRGQSPTLTGPRGLAVTRGRLEAGPALSDLPQNRPVAEVYGVLGALQVPPQPENDAVAAFRADGYVGPISHVDKWRFEDGAGRSLTFDRVMLLVDGSARADEVRARISRDAAGMGAGAAAMTLGGLAVLLSPIWLTTYNKSKNRGLGCDEPGAIDYICTNEDKVLRTGLVVLGGGVVFGGVGYGVLSKHRKRTRTRLPDVLEVANERLGN